MKCLIVIAAFVALAFASEEAETPANTYGLAHPLALGHHVAYAGHHAGYAGVLGYPALAYGAAPALAYGAAPVLPEHNLAYAQLPNLAVPAPVPYGEAPGLDELVTKEKIIAPARAITHITPQITKSVPEFNVVERPYDVPYPVEVVRRPVITKKVVKHPIKVVEHKPVVKHTYTHSKVVAPAHVQTHHVAPAYHHAVPAYHHAAPAYHH